MNIQADVIILGCSLPGIVTAHELKKRFGNTMDLIVLDLSDAEKGKPKFNVSFKKEHSDVMEDEEIECIQPRIRDTVARHYLTKYSEELNIALPECVLKPELNKKSLNKLFQHTNGSTVDCSTDFNDFTYLNVIEKFELNQYQSLLDHSMRSMFRENGVDSDQDRKRMLYYDQTTMEKHLSDALLFPTSKDVMRTVVRLVCGTAADSVSVLFYLHQCYRTNTTKNHLDGDNTRLREKLIGYCNKRFSSQLQQNIADITMSSKPIQEISTYSDEQVILKTMKGETNYVCNLLAMALRPDELGKIAVDNQLLSSQDASVADAMTQGRARKFAIQYETNFWASQGYSGDILSIKGPIIWATEKPRLSTTGSVSKYSTLIGFLKVKAGGESDKRTSKIAVLEQLVKLFGPQAKSYVSYKENDIADVFVPRCGDYVALRALSGRVSPKLLEWGALDIFAEGDMVAALQAGYTAYLHLVTSLRPQCQTYEDLSLANSPVVLCHDPFEELLCQINYKRGIRLVVYTAVICIGVRLLRSFMRK